MDKKLVGLFSLFLIVFTFFAILVLAREPLQNIIRASEDKDPSPKTSILLCWPLKLPVNTQSTCTVFVRSLSSKPITNKAVSFSTSLGKFQGSSSLSDESGKVNATFTCDTAGIAQIQATIDNTIPIDQKISVRCE